MFAESDVVCVQDIHAPQPLVKLIGQQVRPGEKLGPAPRRTLGVAEIRQHGHVAFACEGALCVTDDGRDAARPQVIMQNRKFQGHPDRPPSLPAKERVSP